MAKRPTIAELQAQIAQLTSQVNYGISQVDLLEGELAAAKAEIAALKAAASTPKAAAPAKASYPQIREYRTRDGRWFRKTMHSPNRSSTVQITAPGGEKIAPAESALAASKAACSDDGLMDGVRC